MQLCDKLMYPCDKIIRLCEKLIHPVNNKICLPGKLIHPPDEHIHLCDNLIHPPRKHGQSHDKPGRHGMNDGRLPDKHAASVVVSRLR